MLKINVFFFQRWFQHARFYPQDMLHRLIKVNNKRKKDAVNDRKNAGHNQTGKNLQNNIWCIELMLPTILLNLPDG